VTFSPDGQRLAIGDSYGVVTVCDSQNGREALSLPHQPQARNPLAPVTGLAYSPDGRYIASTVSTSIKVWDATTGAIVHTLQRDLPLNLMACSPDGRRIAYSTIRETVEIWDPIQNKTILTLHGHGGRISGLTYSPDGRRIASAGFDNKVKLWDAENGQEALALHTDGPTTVPAFSSDGSQLAVAANGELRIWDARELSSRRQAQDDGPRQLRWLAWRRQQLQLCISEQNWFAAAHHLDRLLMAGSPEDALFAERQIVWGHLYDPSFPSNPFAR
jgi:WD40 repeat protein